MTLLQGDLIGPLYFGVGEDVLPPVLAPAVNGTRPCRRAQTAPARLSASISDVYEDGAYEDFGSVLEVWLHSRTRWRYQPEIAPLGDNADDAGHVGKRGLDALRVASGEHWYVWNPTVVTIVRRLDYREAIPLLCEALDAAGPLATFNGVVQDYASIWWAHVQENPRLSELSYRQRLERVLRRYVGRKRSHALSMHD